MVTDYKGKDLKQNRLQCYWKSPLTPAILAIDSEGRDERESKQGLAVIP